MSILTLDRVTRRYGAVTALDDLSLNVARGGRTAILGPSGSGKTTLLRLIVGFEAPDRGRIALDGAVLADGPASVPAHLRNIGLVAQEGALFPHLTVSDNIGFGIPRQEDRRAERIAGLATMVGLDAALLRRWPDTLSGGQQQRVALARALARRPRLMLLDEPFSALDTGLRASTRQAVADLLRAEGITTILVTHDQAEALSFADQVVVMREGRLLQAGTPEDVYLRPRDAAVARFLGPAILLPARCTGGEALCPLGTLRVHPGARPGDATVMLREEQIELEPAAPGAGMAVVEQTAFGGSRSSLWLRLKTDGTVITLRASPFRVPRAGDEVSLRILGEAHLLPG
ncbi:ABC transporter ATP-binding protein [Roseomonas gilardii subsp. gilardii]|uniref:ABC transporter ATP-binding protein n=1 Tax=Roseomonas gilardii TaxID=257708 RepID=UPI001FFB3CF2|nr:ABC transporter ATP-binding protein [Roseomonas gilardii]UPG73624.1 ABC transporter ATP-binding protein [Roseomonas gilardii subsp. gilardii]